MRRRWLQGGVALVVLAIIALVFGKPLAMIAPGPLQPGHAELADDCFACHAPWRGASPARCQTCHALADIGLKTAAGVTLAGRQRNVAFHRDLIEPDCSACHSGHQGRAVVLAETRFAHSLLRAEVRGACTTCHAPPADGLHRQIKGECSQCHDSQRWHPATFDHDTLFLLDGDHDAHCETCHAGGDYSGYTCYGCHEHTQASLREEHAEEGIKDYRDCVECHRSARDED